MGRKQRENGDSHPHSHKSLDTSTSYMVTHRWGGVTRDRDKNSTVIRLQKLKDVEIVGAEI